MKKLNGLKIAVCQMKVVPGRPDLNTDYICNEIQAAAKSGIDIVVFPEMATTGYLIGDMFEDISFINDVQRCNERIRLATACGITAIFGSIYLSPSGRPGEDGRVRIHNAAMIAQNGKWVGKAVKFLQPNYRFFDDDRHFYSMRKVREERIERSFSPGKKYDRKIMLLNEYLFPVELVIKNKRLKIGAIICEDMWKDDYLYNPAKVLADEGAEIIFNISASPWTWQKNSKRHRVVKSLLQECKVPLVYTNNTGIQNTGKNIIIFDGSSTIYNRKGERIFEVPPYIDGTFDFTLAEDAPVLPPVTRSDTTELYSALRCAISEFVLTLPIEMRKVIIGLSGGIDSALSAALFVDIIGPENVFLYNMPYGNMSSQETKDIAGQTAKNFGASYEIIPVDKIVEAIAWTTGTKPNTPSFSSIIAKSRKEVLAAKAYNLNGVFVANFNKIEAAFGYGTLYGDMAGFMAPLGDLTKREIYQLARYMNEAVFKREVIPEACFQIEPKDELSEEGRRDPFDYGNENRRGYHDEMVRALTEFRRNPEWFLELFLEDKLEAELKLEKGTLKSLFPSPPYFIRDLENCWSMYFESYRKRVQIPPVPIATKRAFGTDLRESLMSSYLTQRYRDLKKLALSGKTGKRQIVIYGGSFNPPGKHHREIVEALAKKFDLVIIRQRGAGNDKGTTKIVDPKHRRAMAEIAFAGIPKTRIDSYDLENGVFTPTIELEKQYRQKFPDADVWHAIGEDLVEEIQKKWQRGNEVWLNLYFMIIARPDFETRDEDLPPICRIMEIEGLYGSSTLIRNKIARGEKVVDLVDPKVLEYIERNRPFEN